MNAAERLWRALARRDWEAARAQLHPSAVIERPGAGTPQDVQEFLATHRVEAAGGAGDVEVLRALIDGTAAVIEARVGNRRCAAIYDLREGRIAGGVEYWAAPEV